MFFSRGKSAREMLVDILKKAEDIRNLRRPSSLEELAQKYSRRLDEMIIKAEKEEALHYVGGQFDIIAQSESTFSLKVELYFQNSQKEWVCMRSGSGVLNVRYLNNAARQELIHKKVISFDVEEPLTSPDSQVNVVEENNNAKQESEIVPFKKKELS